MLIIGLSFIGLLIAGLKPFWSEPETPGDVESDARSQEPPDLRRLISNCLFQPMPLWMVFVIVGICVTPFAPSAAVLAAILAAVWLVIRGRLKGRKKSRME